MSYYGEQLKERMIRDQHTVKRNERILANSVSSQKTFIDDSLLSNQENVRQIELIGEYFSLEIPPYQTGEEDITQLIDHILAQVGIMKRPVLLDGPWWRDGDAPMLLTYRDKKQVLAVFPDTFSGYYYVDSQTNEKTKITRKNCELFEKNAFCFYPPLPEKSLTGKEFLLFLIRRIRRSDLIMYVLTSILLALIGTIPTYVTQIAFSQIIPSQKVGMLVSLLILLAMSATCYYLMSTVRFALNLRIQCRLDLILENSVYARILSLPATFFKNRTAGAVAQKVSAFCKLPKILGDIMMMFTNILISLVSAIPIFFVASKLVAPTFTCIFLSLAIVFISMGQETRLFWKEMNDSEENSGLVFGLISGIERLRVSGSEQRAYARWLKVYAEKTGATFAVRFPLCVRSQLITTVRLLGLLWAFMICWHDQLSVAQLAAFSSAFGIAIGCIDSIANHGRSISRLKPILDAGEPILKTMPESSKHGKLVSGLTGNIELNNVTFRYEKDAPAVLDNLSLHIHPGEYVAIVGKSGCGKSTLVKLLLGFEFPDRGTIAYDGITMEQLDLHSLRRNIGTVLQDGKLFSGDIFSNITISAPWLGMEEAWDAAEKVGIAEDIRNMPLGMHTYIGEGNGGMSGGQRQRIMIARAIVSKPNMLILDEATSALDNLTQKIVTESMDALKCTRIVIAHRLSTIRACDRILALDHGKIIESGTYDELMEKGGFFAELVKRQAIGEQF